METDQAVTALAALAQETRLAVFRLLVQAGPAGLTVGKISAALDVPPATLSFHLKELAHAELIGSRQEGRFIHCYANFERMDELLGFLTENCCQGAAACGVPLCLPAAPRPRRSHEKVSRPSRRR